MTMTAATLRREPAFSTRLFREQALFAAIFAWPAFTLFFFIVTFAVSLFRGIEVSGWDIGSQVVRWYAFAIGIYLGWSVLQLHVTHGGTRRGYMVQMLTFALAFAAVLSVLSAISLLLESGYYGLMGWPHVPDERGLYASAFDVPMVVLQSFLIFSLWTLGGLFIGAAWYRNGILGAAAIPVGLLAVSVSAVVLGGDDGPMRWVRDILRVEPGVVPAIIGHAVMFAVFAGLTWLAVRDVSIRGKSASA